ncbi:hypothetical protein RUM44_012930 [Polyplax serrata]|uniref:Uncharacterized protein n=1 Tax=Polyplax serrata TaxID=468196 RepID=A0ABR1BCP9_POLSC
MSYRSSNPRGNHSSEANSSNRHGASAALTDWQQFGPGYQYPWQQQHVSAIPQASLNPHQQSNWQNNPSQKSSQMNHKGDATFSWTAPHQTQYTQGQNPQQYHSVYRFDEDPNQYSYGYAVNTANQPPHNTGQQMSFEVSNLGESDPWNWGWDESSNNSAAASFSNNNNTSSSSGNWNTDDGVKAQSVVSESITTNPGQNYFQESSNLPNLENDPNFFMNDSVRSDSVMQGDRSFNSMIEQQNFHEKESKQNFYSTTNNEMLNIKSKSESLGTSQVQNVHLANFQGNEFDSNFDIKSEGALSYHSGSLSNTSEIKRETSSPDAVKTPLTAQALRDFCKEKSDNGFFDMKSKNNSQGLTPQWSIESQMSQETSDDVSPPLEDGSHNDGSMWDTTPEQPCGNEMSQDSNVDASPSLLNQNMESDNSRKVFPLDDIKNFNVSSNAGCMIEEENCNQQSMPRDGLPPSPVMPPRSGDKNSVNPYSRGQNQQYKNSAHSKNYYQKATSDTFHGNECGNLVKEMDACNISRNNLNQQIIPTNMLNVDHNSPRPQSSQGPFKSNSRPNIQSGMIEDGENQETLPDNEERPDDENMKPGPERVAVSKGNVKKPSRSHQTHQGGCDNQEIAPCPDRNQYLETGQLADQSDSLYIGSELTCEPLSPAGLSRHVPGEIQPVNTGISQTAVMDTSPPPLGMHRMVLGQFNENEISASDATRISRGTPPPDLPRMVPGQLNDEQGQYSTEEPSNILLPGARRNDIPPPGLQRMVPGESSRPETQNVLQMPEQRVVTGVAKEEININPLPTTITSQSPTSELGGFNILSL